AWHAARALRIGTRLRSRPSGGTGHRSPRSRAGQALAGPEHEDRRRRPPGSELPALAGGPGRPAVPDPGGRSDGAGPARAGDPGRAYQRAAGLRGRSHRPRARDERILEPRARRQLPVAGSLTGRGRLATRPRLAPITRATCPLSRTDGIVPV